MPVALDPGARAKALNSYALFTQAPIVPHAEVVSLVRARRLYGRGVGWIDAHLLASAMVSRSALYTADAASTATRQQLIDTFVARDVLTLKPEVATERFAGVYTIKREAETGDGFLLVGKTPAEELNFDYVADGKGGFICQQASLEYYVATADESAALYREIEQQLQTKLGKPRTYPSAPDTPYWKLVRRVQASLSDRGSSRRVPNGRVVAIRISEPDGP